MYSSCAVYAPAGQAAAPPDDAAQAAAAAPPLEAAAARPPLPGWVVGLLAAGAAVGVVSALRVYVRGVHRYGTWRWGL